MLKKFYSEDDGKFIYEELECYGCHCKDVEIKEDVRFVEHIEGYECITYVYQCNICGQYFCVSGIELSLENE